MVKLCWGASYGLLFWVDGKFRPLTHRRFQVFLLLQREVAKQAKIAKACILISHITSALRILAIL